MNLSKIITDQIFLNFLSTNFVVPIETTFYGVTMFIRNRAFVQIEVIFRMLN